MSSAGAADGGDRFWTHVALPVSDVAASIVFYQRWTNLTLYETVADSGGAKAARLGAANLGFVLVLIEGPDPVNHALDGFGHLGIECGSRDQVARLSVEADQAGCLRLGPIDSGPPRGYWAVLTDPDGHQLELSHGQHNLPDH
jgi:catechol 2,3-dioxygenase-like lactoylglutathione lyase family enzyme